MNLIIPKCNFSDERGEITDILTHELIDAVTMISSVKGTVRANHYHKDTTQWNYVLEGSVEIITQMKEGPVQKNVLSKGAMACTLPMESHAIVALEDSLLLIFTKGPRNGEDYESDTFRLLDPLA